MASARRVFLRDIILHICPPPLVGFLTWAQRLSRLREEMEARPLGGSEDKGPGKSEHQLQGLQPFGGKALAWVSTTKSDSSPLKGSRDRAA